MTRMTSLISYFFRGKDTCQLTSLKILIYRMWYSVENIVLKKLCFKCSCYLKVPVNEQLAAITAHIEDLEVGTLDAIKAGQNPLLRDEITKNFKFFPS